MIGSCMPNHILQAEIEAECAASEVSLFRGPLRTEDRAEREHALSALARANKVLAAYDPRLTVGPRRGY
ncbi:hypothetical protein [Streptomyces sp. NPDC003023]|uniref:hypothetical protein n=1 Tax=Streptomyces sp. NPDC003023 TaxID=3364675 RepID=UPI0036770A37